MAGRHPLLESAIVCEIERAASAHLGQRWISGAFTDLGDRASQRLPPVGDAVCSPGAPIPEHSFPDRDVILIVAATEP